MTIFSALVWDPSRDIFTIFDHPVRWYGLMFAIGFLVSQQILFYIFQKEGKPAKDVEKLTIYMVLATIIGARLGHVLFYEPQEYLSDPIKILKIWEGGLASHGAAVAILIALFIYSKRHKGQSYFWVLDRMVIVVAFTGALIRFGNFINGEIIGKPTHSNYGVVFAQGLEDALENLTTDRNSKTFEEVEVSKSDINRSSKPGQIPITLTLTFKSRTLDEEVLRGIIEYQIKRLIMMHPEVVDHIVAIPNEVDMEYSLERSEGRYVAHVELLGISRHPAQLYESLSSLLIAIILFLIWYKKKDSLKEGYILGIFLIVLFGLRFFYEFLKENQVDFENTIPLNMGQWLSIPLVIAGVIILVVINRKKETNKE